MHGNEVVDDEVRGRDVVMSLLATGLCLVYSLRLQGVIDDLLAHRVVVARRVSNRLVYMSTS